MAKLQKYGNCATNQGKWRKTVKKWDVKMLKSPNNIEHVNKCV